MREPGEEHSTLLGCDVATGGGNSETDRCQRPLVAEVPAQLEDRYPHMDSLHGT